MSAWVDGLAERSDGRYEVDDTADANRRFACTVDEWCILADGHHGDCNEDRENDPTDPSVVEG